MVLFLLVSMPLLALFLAFLPWNRDRVPRTLFQGLQFMRGALMFFPAWVVLVLLRRVAGFSYSGFPLFLSLLVHAHLAPVLLGLGAFILVSRRRDYPATDEGVFLTAASFLAGFFWMQGIADFVAEFGRWGAHALFMLPIVRIGLVLALAMLARRWERWEGREGLLYCLAGAGAALVTSMASFLLFMGLALVGWLACAALGLAAIIAAAGRFPHVLLEARSPRPPG